MTARAEDTSTAITAGGGSPDGVPPITSHSSGPSRQMPAVPWRDMSL
jgi:hypothetical protein